VKERDSKFDYRLAVTREAIAFRTAKQSAQKRIWNVGGRKSFLLLRCARTTFFSSQSGHPPPCGPAWPHSLQTSDTRIREMPAAHLPMRGERPLAISTESDPASGLVEAQGQMSAGSQAAVAVAYCRINSSDRQTRSCRRIRNWNYVCRGRGRRGLRAGHADGSGRRASTECQNPR